MRPSRAARILGAAVLAAVLWLALPGVRAVRADGPLVPELPAGPTCQASAPVADPSALARLRESLRRLQEREPGPGEPRVVVLDNAGYGYGAGGGDAIEALESELMRVRREQQQPQP